MVSALVHPLLSASERWAPERRHRALVLIAMLPPVLGITGIVSVTLPSLLGLVWPALDHCLIHGGHSHLCFVHGSLHAGHALGWSALAIFVVWQLVWLGRGGVELVKAARAVRALMRSARRDAERGYWVVSSSKPTLRVGRSDPSATLLSDGIARAAQRDGSSGDRRARASTRAAKGQLGETRRARRDGVRRSTRPAQVARGSRSLGRTRMR